MATRWTLGCVPGQGYRFPDGASIVEPEAGQRPIREERYEGPGLGVA